MKKLPLYEYLIEGEQNRECREEVAKIQKDSGFSNWGKVLDACFVSPVSFEVAQSDGLVTMSGVSTNNESRFVRQSLGDV